MKIVIRALFAMLLVFMLPVAAFAQTVTSAANFTTQVPWYVSIASNPALWTTVFAVVSGLVAIWKHSDLKTSQKINQSLVLGIETATSLPEVKAFEDKIKTVIQQKATDFGVQPILHRIVQDLTEPAASTGGSTDSHT